MKHALLFQLVLAFYFSLVCVSQTHQTAGGYTIRHYGVKSYGMHPRNFYITQDQREVMYFGNAYGVIEYDGNTWKSIKLTNGNSGLSIGAGEQGRLYVGSFNELGYLKYNPVGSTLYQSLYQKIPAAENNTADVEGVFYHESAIVYHTTLGLYVYKNNGFQVIKPTSVKNYFSYVQKIEDVLYVMEQNKGLSVLKDGKLEPVPGGEALKNNAVTEILLAGKDRLLIVDQNGISFFDFHTLTPSSGNANNILKQQRLTHALRLENGNVLVTTYNNGFYIVNARGEIVNHVSTSNGLPDNTINYVYTDKRGGLWLALDNGIAYLEINTPFSFIGTDSGIQGMGYAAAVFEGKLYVGTSQGLYCASWSGDTNEKVFTPIKGITGQVWSLSVIDNTLLCCQVDHIYQVKNNQAVVIPGEHDGEGHWKISPMRGKPGYAIKGTYLGFQLYRLENNTWKYLTKLEGFEESSRMFEEDAKGNLWACHGNKGIYQLQLSEDKTQIRSVVNFTVNQGFHPDFFNYVSYINDHLVFSAEDGPYVMDTEKNKLVKDHALEKIIGRNRFISRIIQYNDGNIWVFKEEDVNLYSKSAEGQYTARENIFKKIAGELVGSYEFVLPIPSQLAILGSQEGFIFFNHSAAITPHKTFQVSIRKVEALFKGDTLLYGGNQATQKPVWDYSFNALRIAYAALWYENPEKLKYQYALATKDEQDIQWSGWTTNTQADLSNLFEGEYVFHVRAKNIYEEVSDTCTYSFTILPPWYRSWKAYVLYFILLVIAGYLGYRSIRTRFKRQKEKLELQKQKELLLLEQKHITENLQTEKELIALRNAKLEADMVLKNNELASLATTVTQKTEFLSHLKDKLENIHKDSDNPGQNQNVFKDVIKTIDQDLDFDDNWAKFQLHFDELHHNFLHRLREKYTKLNPSWLLLCAYIRMNKSNKEIASLMNISLSGVEKRKYRLREKLGMDGEDRLSDFISNF